MEIVEGLVSMNRAKRRVIATLVALLSIAALVPTLSRAAVIRQFTAVNDTLLPFTEDNMPYTAGDVYFVPIRVFQEAGLLAFSSVESEWAQLFRGGRWVDFYTARSVAEDQNGNTLNWPSVRRIGSRFYVPLHNVCDYFGLTYEIIEVGRDIIPEQQMIVVRIKTAAAVYNARTFISMNRDALRAAYNDYYRPPPPPPTDTGSPTPPPRPTYGDVTMFLSFKGAAPASADVVIGALNGSADGIPTCFFLSAGDIAADPGLVRMLVGNGCAIGLWLDDGTYDEYLRVSALLFEAAKVRTILISAGAPNTGDEADEDTIEGPADAARAMADERGLLFWGVSQRFEADSGITAGLVAESLPTAAGERANFLFDCSEDMAAILPGILMYLREYDYAMGRISETTKPG
jgi:hypothetical protein